MARRLNIQTLKIIEKYLEIQTKYGRDFVWSFNQKLFMRSEKSIDQFISVIIFVLYMYVLFRTYISSYVTPPFTCYTSLSY